MSDPRDFLPSKYKKPSSLSNTSDALVDPPIEPSKDLNTDLNMDIDSPWADLAKEPASLGSSLTSTPLSSDINLSLDSKVMDEKPEETMSSSNSNSDGGAPSITSRPKSKNKAKITGLLVIAFLVVGVVASYLLTQQSQDLRQQAHMLFIPLNPDGSCDTGYSPGTVDGVEYCIPDSGYCPDGMNLITRVQENGRVVTECSTDPTPTPPYIPPSGQGTFGWCWDAGGVGGHPCSASDWTNPNQLIAGTYVWPPGCSGSACHRYIINDPNTLEAAVEYATQYPVINTVLYEGNGSGNNLEIAPFLICSSSPSSTGGYNVINCATEGSSCTTLDFSVSPPRCYLTTTAYQEMVEAGNTWSPYNTGCGDGVHDYDGPDGYLGDCNTWHFTECLEEGSGVNGYGCGAITPTQPPPPPTTITITLTTTLTPTPSITITPTVPELVCVNIEMLDSQGNIMSGNDDENLMIGDQVRFRSRHSGQETDDQADPRPVTFQFRIMPPNSTTWTDISNYSDVAASDVSAMYTIISSGPHIVQSRICAGQERCQLWENISSVESHGRPPLFNPIIRE